MSSDASLERVASRAYERGRLRLALVGGVVVIALASVSLHFTESSLAHYAVAAGLSVLVGIYLWRGGDAGNALLPGLLGGLAPLVISAVLLECRSECSGLCMQHCFFVCAGGATIAGLLAAYLTRSHPRRGKAWALAVALVPLAGLLGCPHVGYGQLAGLGLGLALSRVVSSVAS
ncbi:MAG: hypothetical protein QM784_30685 [Polyangiaceae bacterium]